MPALPAMDYPPTRRDDLVETLHGVEVPDPYRWLEDTDAPETREWIEAQNALTRSWLDADDTREAVRARLTEIWDYPKVGIPWRRGDRWFQLRNAGLQQQAVLWTMPAPDAEGEVLLDPNTLSEDGTVALGPVAVTDDGSLLAYAISEAGSDWHTWRVRDIATGEDLPDEAPWSKFSGAAWLHDGSGFFYSAYDPPPPGATYAHRNKDHQLRFHRLGATEEVTVHARPDEPDWGFSPAITEDGRWLVVTVFVGTDPRTRIHLADLTAAEPTAVQVTPWLDDFDAEYSVIGNVGDTFYVLTDRDAPRRRVLAITAADPTDQREVVPEGPDTILSATIVGNRIVSAQMVDAAHRLRLHTLDGTPAGEVPLPDIGSITGLSGRQEDTSFHFGFTSFARSGSIHRHDLDTGRTEEVRPASRQLDDVVTELHLVDSTDGARVPLFLVRPADAPRDGTLPVLQYGYGGFGIPLSPQFSLWWTAWLERGGAIAVGCYRGGGEYGREWHDAGRQASKQHTFDDAVACARWLADSGWTTPQRIAITGGSNGGLTAAAAMLDAPDAFGACIPEVGVLDLLRFTEYTIGWAWTSDYGDPADPDDFARLLRWSPYHRITPGRRYPATLVVTGDHDDRVIPGHSFKFAAALQHAQDPDGPPVLIRVDTRAGHGAATPTSKVIDARADVLTFLDRVLVRGLAATG